MTKKQIKRVAKEFADQAMNQRSDDHDEDTDEESISPEGLATTEETKNENESNETGGADRAGG